MGLASFPQVCSDTATWFVPEWPDVPGLVAGFTSRQWRQSAGDPWRSDWSFRRPPDESAPPGLAHLFATLELGDMRVIGQHQVHEDTIQTIADQPATAGRFHLIPHCDALIVTSPGLLALGQSADCCLGLLVAPEQRIAAIFQAGWRGAVLGLPGKVVAELREEHDVAPASLWVAISPAIQSSSFQVGPEVAREFQLWSDRLGLPLVVPDPETPRRFRADLPGLVAAQLRAHGIPDAQLALSTLDTVANPDLCFSYRRDGAGMGLHAGFIGWRPER